MTKYLIQAIGAFASGKSRLITSVGLSYGVTFRKGNFFHTTPDDTCMIGGYYNIRFMDLQYTGGFDADTMKPEERISKIEHMCSSNYRIVAFEGTLSTVYKKYWDWYDSLPREKIVIFLNPPLEVLKQRITKRGGKSLSKKRIRHLEEKIAPNKQFYDHAKETDGYITLQSEFTTEEHHLNLLRQIEDITGIKMKEYILKPKIRTLRNLWG